MSTIPASEQQERSAKRFWVGAIVGLLSLQLIGGIFAAYLALSDPTVAVIPNYYQSGLNWDAKKRSLDLFDKLGWVADFKVLPTDDLTAMRELDVRLYPPNDTEAVGKQRVSATIYHHARGSEIHQVVFTEVGEGRFVGDCPLTQAGLWQVDLLMEGDQGIAETRFTIEVNPAGDSSYTTAKS